MTKLHISQDHADPFLTTREAALLLGVSLRSVQLWVEAGTLDAAVTPGGHRRIRTSAVHALAAKMGIKLPDPGPNPLQIQLDAATAELITAREKLATQDALIGNLCSQVGDLQAQLDAAKLAGVVV